MPKKEPAAQSKKTEQALEIKDLKKGKDARVEAQAAKVKGGGVKDHSV